MHDIHLPEEMDDVYKARRRLVFDELFRVQVALVRRKLELERTTPGIVHDLGGRLVHAFHERLPYPLTGAQERVIAEIEADLGRTFPMHRLLQGDVGSGKTVVAVSALLVAVQGGHQGALMAPTEVLAEQHHLGLRDLLADLTVPDDSTLMGERPLRLELLTNRTTGAERTRLLGRPGGRDRRPRRRHPRPDPGPGQLPVPRAWSSSTSSTGSASSSGRPCGTPARVTGCPTCW